MTVTIAVRYYSGNFADTASVPDPPFFFLAANAKALMAHLCPAELCREPMTFAGLWDEWRNKAPGEVLKSCTISHRANPGPGGRA